MQTGSDRSVAPLVGGRYRLAGLLASGGMGDVYEAQDTVLRRTVALKILRATLGGDAAFIARFRSEATNAARLSHPNIVQVYDFGEDAAGSAWIAMEFVPGQTLRDVLASRGRLDPGAAAQVALQVCAALEHARRAGIVHRDVKPENILVATDGQVKVADFGLSRAIAEAEATQDGHVLGTPHYIAPEQVLGDPADHRSDVYALGVVLFEMLTGRPPFRGESAAAIAYRRTSEDVPSPRSLLPALPPALDDVVLRATARQPEARYPSAAAMSGALRSAHAAPADEIASLVNETVSMPLGQQETIHLPQRRRAGLSAARRRRRRALIGAAVALALVGGGTPVLVSSLARETVPSVAGVAKAAAETAIEEAGLRPVLDFENSATVEQGLVVRTEPQAGTSLRKGSEVRLVVSLGPVTIAMPDVRGMPYADAERALRAEGLEAERADEFHATVEAGSVIAQSRRPDELVAQGTLVRLRVSKGRDLVEVPDVSGRAESDAVARLEKAGLTARVERRFDEKVAEGKVLSQSPGKGAEADRGSAVTIVVSKGPPLVSVPTIACMTPAQAEDALDAKGLRIKYERKGKRVIDQDPIPGTQVPRGSVITAVLGSGYC